MNRTREEPCSPILLLTALFINIEHKTSQTVETCEVSPLSNHPEQCCK